MTPHIVGGMTAARYHDDPASVPSLSATTAKHLDQRSPAHAYRYHPRLGGGPSKHTAALTDGQAIHALVLDPESDGIVVVEHEDFRKSDARIARDEALDARKTPICRPKFERLREVAEVIRAKMDVIVPGILSSPASAREVSVFWEETTGGAPVPCRARLDAYMVTPGRVVIVDLKTTEDAHPRKCSASVESYGYAIQAAAYCRGLRAALELARDPDFVFLFAELEPPYAVYSARLSEAYRTIGERRWLRAVETWSECLRTNEWPDYSADGVGVIQPPAWAISRELTEGLEPGKAA